MPSRLQVSLFIFFVVALAVWVGGGVFLAIATHAHWYSQPVEYIRSASASATAGEVNPWPITTAIIALATLSGLVAFARYRGPGRREALGSMTVVLVVLVATFAYFVPTLLKFAKPEILSDAQIVSMSRTWVVANLVRIASLLGVLILSQVALLRFGKSTRG